MQLAGKDLWNSKACFKEVWFSPSGFKRDDTVSKGFIRLAQVDAKDDFAHLAEKQFLAKLNEGAKHWTTSEISTAITKKLDWNLPTELPDFQP